MAVQLTFVRLLSKEATQTLTFHCRNSVAYKDESAGNLKKAAILKGADGVDLRAYGNNRMKYTVTEDSCSVRCFALFVCFPFMTNDTNIQLAYALSTAP